MKNNEIHTTSSLRRERNILDTFRRFSPERYDRPKIHNTGIGSLSILFMECLIKRGIRDKMVLQWCTELRPFFEYIEETYRITAIADLDRSHIAAYATMVRDEYEQQEKTFMNAADANDLLSAVRMFCIYLYSAGVTPEDYGDAAPVIPYPVNDMLERKEKMQ